MLRLHQRQLHACTCTQLHAVIHNQHTHAAGRTNVSEFAGKQLPPGVHRHAGAAAWHQRRLLEDGVGARRPQCCHGDTVCGEGTGE